MGKYLEQQYEERDYALELAKKHKLLPEGNSNLTWEELKEKAKEMGYKEGHNGLMHQSKQVLFFENNVVAIGEEIFCNISYDKMLAIMKALQ